MGNKQRAASPFAGIGDTAERTAERMAHLRSGAAGVHADQKTRATGTFRTNRVGSRSAQRRAAVADHS